MSKLRKRDEADRNIERQRPGATLMMTCESSANSEHETPISLGVKIEVCAPASNKVHNVIHETDCVRPKMKPSKRPPDPGNGKLPEGTGSQREATESGRVAVHAAR